MATGYSILKEQIFFKEKEGITGMLILGLLTNVFLIYLVAAVGPAAALMLYIYRKDKVEKEPAGLLARLILAGAASAVLAMVLEMILGGILGAFFPAGSGLLFLVLEYFIVVAASEEAAKYLFLKRVSWRHPAFNFRFDGVVYAVFVSLGFAALENIMYVVGFGLGVAPVRALLAIPAHMSFGVVMGYFYGRAKIAEIQYGDPLASKSLRRKGVLAAVLMHGFYDTCASVGTTISSLVFLIL